MLVVNAANRQRDWHHLQAVSAKFEKVAIADHTHVMAMLSVQGPLAKEMLARGLSAAQLPEPRRNALSVAGDLWLARTGYTGESIGFELFMPAPACADIWQRLLAQGAQPAGLGARDTLRLEAGLPLYGHELGLDPQGHSIPVFAAATSRSAVSFSPLKGDFIGKQALLRQFTALKALLQERPIGSDDLPHRIRPLHILGRGIARRAAPVFYSGRSAGWVTSGTMVPYWQFEGQGLQARMTSRTGRRAIALGYIDAAIRDGETVTIAVQGKELTAVVMPYLLRSEAPPFARPIAPEALNTPSHAARQTADADHQARIWLQRTHDNTIWRRQQCINLIPSEQTPSPMVRLLTIMDPMGRYAEHKPVKAFADHQVFYYQGTDFIAAVEEELALQLQLYLGCRLVETRPISGQMANMIVFSALTDFFNRTDRKREPRRIRRVMNYHLTSGGHLSAQPLGALRDFIMRDPVTERPAVVNFPCLADDPYQMDLAASQDLIARYQPELIILGKSMALYKEPVAELRGIIDEVSPATFLLYDMAHVLGLAGPHYQDPFAEGADLITASTHKTFFGTQRGIVAVDFQPGRQLQRELWEAIDRRSFPGSLSNHHLGTLLGLLLAAFEMNAFKDNYQPKVIANARAFAAALKNCGFDVAGDPHRGYTETHQVIIKVGHGSGPQAARLLEANHIICNFQAIPEDEGFTAAGGLRLGVAEMTRFGMDEPAFETLAQLMAEILIHGHSVGRQVQTLRHGFLEMDYCFKGPQIDELLEKLHRLV
jgi:aminomethyltransferase